MSRPLVVLLALAASSPADALESVEIALEFPVSRTRPVTCWSCTSGYSNAWVSAYGDGLYGAIDLDVGLRERGDLEIRAVTGLRTWTRTWKRESADFTATLWEGHGGVGLRYLVPNNVWDSVRPWASAGAGLQVGVLALTWWPTHITPGLHHELATGLAFGGDNLQWTVGVEAELVLRVDSYEGSAVTGEGWFGWTYWPGSASVSARTGLRFR